MRLIDADALKDSLKGTVRYFDVVADIDAMPTIEVVKRGRWKSDGGIGCICSYCGKHVFLTKYHSGRICENCGAVMEV